MSKITISGIISKTSNYLWQIILMPLLLGTGIFLTIRLGFIQLFKLKESFKLVFRKEEEKGEITYFQALAAGLSGTVGVGNIAGVATAIAAGGPGALFWMWITAIFGMAIKFTSATLAHLYRKEKLDGSIRGGPMYYLKDGVGSPFLASLFALFTVIATFGIGNMTQSNTVAHIAFDTFGIPKIVTGIVIAFLAGLVIIGGIKRIGKVASALTPLMGFIYLTSALIILVLNYDKLPHAFKLVFSKAFSSTAAAGGFLGSTVLYTIRMGVARGLYSNESGLGSSPMIYATIKTDNPVKAGLLSMLGPFIDTIIICSLTGLTIIVTSEWLSGKTGAVLTSSAFSKVIPSGNIIVAISIILFAFSTLISWSYYGDTGIEYLFGPKSVLYYRILFIIAIPVGAIFKLTTIWNLSDIANGLMAIPNLIGLLLLHKQVVKLAKNYFIMKK